MAETVKAVLPSGTRVTGPAGLLARMGGRVEPAPSVEAPRASRRAARAGTENDDK